MEGHMRKLVTVVVAVAFVAACGQAPDLPPQDSMELPDFQNAASTALVSADQGTTANVTQAAASVGLVSVALFFALLPARVLFAGVVSERAKRDGDHWVWSHTFPLAGWEGEMRGRLEDTLTLEMKVTGIRDNTNHIQDFTWYTGDHGTNDGQWVLFHPDKTGPIIEIDWARASATDKDLAFTNVDAGADQEGDSLAYALKGDLASMVIHDELDDAGGTSEFTVEWNVVSGAGKITRVSGDTACWETIANGQVDMACPSGDWPEP
jgi:hypothetical protein